MLSVCFSACLSSSSLPTPPKGFESSFDQSCQKALQFLQSQESRLVSKVGKVTINTPLRVEKQIYILLNVGESAPEFLITFPPLTEQLVTSVGEFRPSA